MFCVARACAVFLLFFCFVLLTTRVCRLLCCANATCSQVLGSINVLGLSDTTKIVTESDSVQPAPASNAERTRLQQYQRIVCYLREFLAKPHPSVRYVAGCCACCVCCAREDPFDVMHCVTCCGLPTAHGPL